MKFVVPDYKYSNTRSILSNEYVQQVSPIKLKERLLFNIASYCHKPTVLEILIWNINVFLVNFVLSRWFASSPSCSKIVRNLLSHRNRHTKQSFDKCQLYMYLIYLFAKDFDDIIYHNYFIFKRNVTATKFPVPQDHTWAHGFAKNPPRSVFIHWHLCNISFIALSVYRWRPPSRNRSFTFDAVLPI